MYCDERRKNKIRADDILGALAGIGQFETDAGFQSTVG